MRWGCCVCLRDHWLCWFFSATFNANSTGANHKTLLPLSAIAGGTILTLCDVFARQLFTSNELPIGLLTSAIGDPVFLIVLVVSTPKAVNLGC